MKDKKSLLINIIYILSIFSLIFFASQLFINNLLPANYRYIAVGVLALIYIIIGILLIKQRNNKIVYIVTAVFLVLMLLVQTVAGAYIYKTYSSYNSKIEEVKTRKTVFYIITLKTNEQVDTIEDMKKATVYYDKHDSQEDLEILKEEVSRVNNEIDYVEASGALELANDLINSKIKYMLLNEARLPIIEEGISEFRQAYKVVKLSSSSDDDKIEIERENKPSAKDIEAGQSFNLFISGGDSYGGLEYDLRSDVNILLTINPEDNKILITQIPRDSYVMMRDLGYDKLTHSSTYGIETLIGTIEDLLETDINYYVKVNFNSLEDIVDALGGISVYNDYEFTSRSKKLFFPVGQLDLDGVEALEFVRERYSLPNGEFDRGKNQMKVLTSIINKAISPSIIFNYTSVLDTVLDSIVTNFPSSKITEMINEQISSMASWQIESHQIDGYPVGGLFSYTMPDYSLSFVQLYEDEVIAATERIKRTLGNNVEESIDSVDEIYEDEDTEYYIEDDSTEDYNTEDGDWDY